MALTIQPAAFEAQVRYVVQQYARYRAALAHRDDLLCLSDHAGAQAATAVAHYDMLLTSAVSDLRVALGLHPEPQPIELGS